VQVVFLFAQLMADPAVACEPPMGFFRGRLVFSFRRGWLVCGLAWLALAAVARWLRRTASRAG